MWPDNNVDGRHSCVTFQNSSEMPNSGLIKNGVRDITYPSKFDTQKRQWYQLGRKLYDANPVPPRGHAAYHNQVISWYPLFVLQMENPTLSVGLTAPLYGPEDEYVGVMSIDMSTKSISYFLREQKYGKTGVGYVVRSKNYVHSHGGVEIDEYVDMTYNNHVGVLLGVSQGLDHGKACGNDYTNNTEQDQYPHYYLDETEWFNSRNNGAKDSTTLDEMVLPVNLYCCLKNNKTSTIEPTNRAVPAANHENPLISSSAEYIQNEKGGFDGLAANALFGNITYEYADEKEGKTKVMLLQWTLLKTLEFPGFRPLIVVVVPKDDYMSDVLDAKNDGEKNINKTMNNTKVAIIISIIITIICSVLVTRLINLPLKRLNDEILRLASFDIRRSALKNESSFIHKVVSIQNSFRGMKMELTSFSKFVPYAVVKRIVGGDVSATLLGVKKRHVTIMFADIAKFTSFVERWPIESVMQVLKEYLTAMVSVIKANGGTIRDFIGDCIMVFWNSPLDQPNHAQLALDTAFEMEKKLSVWSEMLKN